MGYVVHDAVIVTTWRHSDQWPDVDAFRESLPEHWRPLVVGPISSITNFDTTWFFGPDGSKSGWDTDAEGERYRRQFEELFTGQEYGFDVVRLAYGADFKYDHPEPRAEYV